MFAAAAFSGLPLDFEACTGRRVTFILCVSYCVGCYMCNAVCLSGWDAVCPVLETVGCARGAFAACGKSCVRLHVVCLLYTACVRWPLQKLHEGAT